MDANMLFVIKEKYVNFNDFEGLEKTLREAVNKQKLSGYFNILDGPVYTNLVKDFWMNASVVPAGDKEIIQSYVNGNHVFITPSLIALTINCEEFGSCVEHYESNNVYANHLYLLYANKNNLASPASLRSIPKFWFQLLVSNLRPREKDLEGLTWYDKHLLLFLTYNMRVNLPLTIFNFLKKMIETSREEKTFLIPYGRDLSELFNKLGMVGDDDVVVEWTEKFEFVE